MVKRIFKNTFITSIVAIILSALLILWADYEYTEEEMLESLESQATILAHGIDVSGDKFFSDFEIQNENRITWISKNGDVLFDSSIDKSDMDNHSEREEILEAVENGEGETIRYSETLSQKTMYYAKLLNDGTVIRISCAYDNLFATMFVVIKPIIFIVFILSIIMYIVANYTAKAIVKPINNIDLESGQIEDLKDYVEIKPLLSRIKRQNILIDANIRELKREHAKRENFRREFTANVSHELKTPLTSIAGISEMFMNGIIKPEDVPEFAGNINKEAERLINLVKDIILISRLEEKEITTQKEKLDLYEIAMSVKKRLQVVAHKKGVKITVKSVNNDENKIYIFGVYNMIEELLFNLMDNAIKYNRDNGRVNVIIKENDKQVEIDVEDNGIGIPNDEKNSVFERFYRVDKSRSKEVGGTGLGLSIVKHIAIYHGGSVYAEDRVGGGTRMVVNLCK